MVGNDSAGALRHDQHAVPEHHRFAHVVGDEHDRLARAQPQLLQLGVELEGAFKPSSLRNIAATGPYMHAGQFATLREVLEHYEQSPEPPVGHTELKPLQLSAVEMEQLEAFLRSLSGGIVSPP